MIAPHVVEAAIAIFSLLLLADHKVRIPEKVTLFPAICSALSVFGSRAIDAPTPGLAAHKLEQSQRVDPGDQVCLYY